MHTLQKISVLALQAFIGAGILMLPAQYAFADALTLSVNSVSPGTSVQVGQVLTFTAVGGGSSGLTYLVFDSFPNSSLTSSAINATTGAFSWTPVEQDRGTHTLSVETTTGTGLVEIVNMTIGVGVTVSNTASGTLSLQSLSPGYLVTPGQMVTITTIASGFTPTSYSLGDSLSGSSIINANIDATGHFSWIPTAGDIGIHSITVTARDASGTTASANFSVEVQKPSNSTTATTATTPTQTVIPVTIPVYTPSSISFTALQIQAVQAILQAFGASQSVVAQVTAILSGSGVPASTQTTLSSAMNGYYFTSFMGPGSSGEEVRQLQLKLTAGGYYSGAITAYFGPATETAVKQFQTAHGISALGYVGPSTRTALNAQ